jgi:Alpha-mannosidase
MTEKWKLVDNGPEAASFKCRYSFLSSSMEQIMTVYASDRRIDFKTVVDMKDKKKLIRACFPVAVRARVATYDLPFGCIERPTHDNTTWEQAKFEVCGHLWADLSEHGYGVALLNDSKYGYSVKGNTICLSLLRSPIRPDADSDIGHHEFTYSLYPHEGRWDEGLEPVDRKAMELNNPLITTEKSKGGKSELKGTYSFLSLSDDRICETIKEAEDSDSLMLRIYDKHGGRGITRYSLGVVHNTSAECDLLENETAPLDSDELSINPFEIKTVRIEVKR